MKYEDDIYYINQVLQGNTFSYTHLINKHKNSMFNLAMKILKNRESAEECVQDAFLKAFNSLSEFRVNSKFSTWLYKIVYNTSISASRKFNPQKSDISELEETLEDDNIISALDNLHNEEKIKYINLALDSLEETDRALIVLYYFDEKSIEEISEITNLASANIKTKLFRSRKKLYSKFDNLLKSELLEWV